jgi:hypothetical protein
MSVKWECLDCGYVWDGIPNEERIRRAFCPRCNSHYVYPGWKTERWTQVSTIVKKMRGNRCEECGATDTTLNAHHKVPVSAGGSSQAANLMVLCHGCHYKQHNPLAWLIGIVVPSKHVYVAIQIVTVLLLAVALGICLYFTKIEAQPLW